MPRRVPRGGPLGDGRGRRVLAELLELGKDVDVRAHRTCLTSSTATARAPGPRRRRRRRSRLPRRAPRARAAARRASSGRPRTPERSRRLPRRSFRPVQDRRRRRRGRLERFGRRVSGAEKTAAAGAGACAAGKSLTGDLLGAFRGRQARPTVGGGAEHFRRGLGCAGTSGGLTASMRRPGAKAGRRRASSSSATAASAWRSP